MGGKSAGRLPRIGREHILNAYKAGPEAVVSLVEYLQDQFQAALDEMNGALAELSENNKKLVAGSRRWKRRSTRTATTATSLPPATDWPGGSAGNGNPAARNLAARKGTRARRLPW